MLVFIFVSGKFSGMSTGPQKGHAGLGYEYTFKVQVELISGGKFNQIFTVTKQVGCDSPCKYEHLFTYISTYLV